MKIRTGIDIVEFDRFKERVNNPDFLKKIFTDNELHNKQVESLAGTFALKEAFFKATQIKIKNWKDIEIKKSRMGKPIIDFLNLNLEKNIHSVDCSVSHENKMVVAIVVLLLKS
ncbi:holo-ACP synthase [Candidatus Woesearchaeota archaeon]|nr:holo-ACP synthase [Candidatus Woesearchaeota archaeon]